MLSLGLIGISDATRFYLALKSKTDTETHYLMGKIGGIGMTERIFKGIGKYLVFCLLNGLGGIVVASIFTSMVVDNLAWMLGHPKAGTSYGAIVEVISWSFWGWCGALVAVLGYSMIFKEFPPRWMGITSISVLIFGGIFIMLAIVGGLAFGEEIELRTWEDFAHATTSIVTFWYLFRLPPFSRNEYDMRVAP